jgi:hypothetical protein
VEMMIIIKIIKKTYLPGTKVNEPSMEPDDVCIATQL